MKHISIVTLAVILSVTASYAVETIEEKGTVKAVTLFRGQALVTRVIPVKAAAGPVQLTIKDLPPSVMSDSLFVNANADIQVRAVRYHTQATGKAPEKEVQVLDEKIAAAEKELRANVAMKKLALEKKAYLDKMSLFVAPTARVEMTKGILNAETLGTVTAMVFDNRSALAQTLLELEEEELDIQQELDLLRRKRSELSHSHTKILRQAIVFLDKTGNGNSALRLSYLVTSSSWSPIYSLRGSANSDKVSVQIGALANQTSGENWNSVDLTLSTAGARMAADGPTLAPLWLSLAAGRQTRSSISGLEKRARTVASNMRTEYGNQMGAVIVKKQRAAQWNMNNWGQEWQQLELANDPADIRDINRKLGKRASGLAVTYKIGGKVSIASQNDNQMVQIDKLELSSKFFYEATPLLTEQVYRYAEMVNDSSLSLLGGIASIYLDGEFVGKATLPMVARGQKVTVGFGTDPQLRAWREFVSKESKGHMIGSKKEVNYTYRLVLDNYSSKSVTVRVLDRIPVETEAISVELAEMKDSLCEDAHYLRAYRPNGILRWDVKVPAKAARETARIIDYGFKLEFDGKYNISTAAPAAPSAKQKAVFDEMMEMRMQMH